MRLRPATSCHYHSQVNAPKQFSPKTRLLIKLLTLACAAAVQSSVQAQAPFNANVYRVGERLTYNVNFSNFVSAAHAEVLIAGRGTFYGRDGIQLKAHVETIGVVNV